MQIQSDLIGQLIVKEPPLMQHIETNLNTLLVESARRISFFGKSKEVLTAVLGAAARFALDQQNVDDLPTDPGFSRKVPWTY
ncbi:MAG: hypothetical protein H7327_13835 [Herminiimonas sp.]|nr:hypothetical protein [Herminiimonas sp.]